MEKSKDRKKKGGSPKKITLQIFADVYCKIAKDIRKTRAETAKTDPGARFMAIKKIKKSDITKTNDLMHDLGIGFQEYPVISAALEEKIRVDIDIAGLAGECTKARMSVGQFIDCFNSRIK